MKKTILFIVLLWCSLVGFSQALKIGTFKSYDAYTDNDPSKDPLPTLSSVIRINKLDVKYSDTLYKIDTEAKNIFAIYDGKNLYVKTEDSLYRKMDFTGRYPFVKITTKVHLEGRWIYVNKTPFFEEEHDAVQSYVAFVNKKGKWEAMGFESIRELIKGNRELLTDYDKEKWNNDIFMKYLLKMNEKYPIK